MCYNDDMIVCSMTICLFQQLVVAAAAADAAADAVAVAVTISYHSV